MESKNNVDNTITTLEMCAGYGGIGLGLKNIFGERLRTIAYCELEGFAQANLISKMEKGLLDAAPIWSDLKTFPYQSFYGLVDILIAGYPCQPFSAAGKRAGKDDPRHLWPWIAGGIRILRPRMCFFENVEGHISLGLSTVISDLEELGYKVSWGIFSASEVGAPHQRKRVFIMANRKDERFGRWSPKRWEGQDRQERREVWHQSLGQGDCGAEFALTSSLGSEAGISRPHQGHEGIAGVADHCGDQAWPSRPGEPQHAWEPPRVVGNATSKRPHRGTQDGLGLQPEVLGKGHEAMGNASDWSNGQQQTEQQGRNTSGRSGEESGANNELSQTQPSLGLHSDESSSFLGQALTLNPYGDNVYAYENISKKIRAREVLFSVWREAISKEIQWTAGGLQYFLAEKVLQSGMQLDAFTQRICYFVWCIQTGHKAQGWGLHGMWVCETCGNSSQGQKPIEQLQRELGYAMCQLSYEIALEGRKDAVETEGILQGVREASERAWTLSQALPEMEEIWRSSLDQAVWEKGCYVEAASIGNRTDELRLLGNGVVPATAERAFRVLIEELNK